MKAAICGYISIIISLIIPTQSWADTPPPTPGKIVFAEIEQLPKKWWKHQDEVWKTWDPNTYYLWGANRRNYKLKKPHQHLSGSGMASAKGPTRGRGHPNYIGVITTSLSFNINDKIFGELENNLRNGGNVVIPVYRGRYALGTGVAFKRFDFISGWYRSQKYLFEQILKLSSIAEDVEIEEGVYWPDCGETMKQESTINFYIRDQDDVLNILSYLETKIEK